MRRYFLVPVFSCLLAFMAQAQDKKVDLPGKILQISTLEGSKLGELCMLTATAAWNRAGYTVKPFFLPAKRSLREVAAGKFDAEACRIHAAGDKFPSLRRVDASPLGMHNYAWFAAKKAPDLDFSRIQTYHVGIIAGILRTNSLTENWQRSTAATTPQLMKMLLSGRIDAAITSEITGTITINRDFDRADFIRSPRPLTVDPLYQYLYQSNAALLPLITKTILEMQEDKSLDRIKEEYLAREFTKDPTPKT